MGSVTLLKPKPLTIYNWGDGIADIRYFTTNILMPSELEKFKDASGYMPQALDFEGAVNSIRLTVDGAPPGIYFCSNPHSSTYGKWNMALVAAGFTRVPGCALNRVWGNWQAYKGPGSKNVNSYSTISNNPWESPDGFEKWMHAFYFIKPGRKEPISLDFTEKTRNLQAWNGDADLAGPGSKGSLWHINYGGGPNIFKKYPHGAPAWCKNYGRLSKSCGIAMGYGLPECGAALDEEFFTIAIQEDVKGFPKGWSPFLRYGGMEFATNIAKLPSTAQVECPHSMKL